MQREPPTWVIEMRASFEKMLREGDEQTHPQVFVMPDRGKGGTMLSLLIPKPAWRMTIASTIASDAATDVLFITSMWASKASSPEKLREMRERKLTPQMDPEHEHQLAAIWKSRDGSTRWWTLAYELDSKGRAVNVAAQWDEVRGLSFVHLDRVFDLANALTARGGR